MAWFRAFSRSHRSILIAESSTSPNLLLLLLLIPSHCIPLLSPLLSPHTAVDPDPCPLINHRSSSPLFSPLLHSTPALSPLLMSRRKRKEDDGDEQKEDKRSKLEPAAAAASSSSSSAAAAASSPAHPQLAPTVAGFSSPPAAASLSAAAAASSSSRPLAELEDGVCSACHEAFECADSSARLPRTLPCNHLLCTSCIRNQLRLTAGYVLCPLDQDHGQQKINTTQRRGQPQGSAAAAAGDDPTTMEAWLREMRPANELIASIKNQQSLMTPIGQQGTRCSRPGCEAAVTQYCQDCGDLCTTHQRKLHALEPFQSHKAKTMIIAEKSAYLRQQKQSKFAGSAAAIRAQANARLLQQQMHAQIAEDELKQIEVQLQQKRSELEAKEKTLSALQQTVNSMSAADDSTVLEMEADRLEAEEKAMRVPRPVIDSKVLNTLPDDRILALQSFLGADRLSKAKLIYRASRDGFAPKDWWRLCGGKSNLLTLIRVKRNGFVFGAWTPFQWPVSEPKNHSVKIADPMGTTFLFSLVNAHNRAIKLRLKESHKAHAGRVFSNPVCGPSQSTLFSHAVAHVCLCACILLIDCFSICVVSLCSSRSVRSQWYVS